MNDRHATHFANTHFIDHFVGIPLDSTGRFEGCQLMPGALRHAGLLPDTNLDAGNLQVSLADPRRDPVTHVTSSDDLLAASRVISDATYDLAYRGLTPLLIGGDCSMLIGIVNGLRRHDPDVGLIMIDGHFDMHTPLTSESGDAADMEITLLTDSRSPFSSLGGSPTALDLERIAFIGPRDHDEMVRLGSRLPHDMSPRPYIADQQTLVHTPVTEAAAAAIRHLENAGTSGYWVHIDLDVLTTRDMPAVDYPQPGGLSWSELSAVAGVLLRSLRLQRPQRGDPQPQSRRRRRRSKTNGNVAQLSAGQDN